MTIGDKYLYNWVFRYNPYKELWYAVKREHYNDLFSDLDSEDVLKSKEISTLVYLIKKTNGNQHKIKTLLK